MLVTIVNPPSLKKIAFVREGRCEQRISSFQYNMTPISLFSVASVLKEANFAVEVFEGIANRLSVEDFLRYLTRAQPSLIIVNIASATYNDDIKIVEMVKQKFPSIHISAIGNHVSALCVESLRESALDSIIIGEPELIALKLAQAIRDGKYPEKIESLCYRRGDEIISNPREKFIEDLDGLPFPDRSLAPNEKYFLPIVKEPYTLIITSRGCPHECIFCSASLYYGKKLRERSCKNIIAEIGEVVRRYKIHNITMWSDTFTLRRQFVLDICNSLIENKIKINWWCNSRVDKVDPQMLSVMKESGCAGISYGVESGVQEILDNVKKKITLQDIVNAFKWTNQAGIESLAHVIFGLPGETPKTIRATLNFVLGLKPSYAQFYCAIPFPGTELYKMAIANQWLITNDWSKFEINQAIISTGKLSNKELERARNSAFKTFYLHPRFLFNQLKKVRSWKGLITKLKQGKDFFRNWVATAVIFYFSFLFLSTIL